MPALLADASLHQVQLFLKEVYMLPNDRHYELSEMLCNIQRFAMRGLKGIRQGDVDKIKRNLIISFSWFMSTINRLHIDLEEAVWARFPYVCSYCARCPCICKSENVDERREVFVDNNKHPKSLKGFQQMFQDIYPSESRTLAHVAMHLAEEVGEFSESLWVYRGERRGEDFKNILAEAADFFTCVIGVFNALQIDLADELAKLFTNNCHICHRAPCACSYNFIKQFRS